MIRRARWTRPFAALFALWFAIVLGDPGLLHSCPMHGGHGAAHATASSATSGHHMAAMHGTHSDASAGVASHAAVPDASHHGSTGPCTCIGQCCAMSAVASLPVASDMHVPATVSRVEPPTLVAFGIAPAAPDTRLPFANGPPTA